MVGLGMAPSDASSARVVMADKDAPKDADPEVAQSAARALGQIGRNEDKDAS